MDSCSRGVSNHALQAVTVRKTLMCAGDAGHDDGPLASVSCARASGLNMLQSSGQRYGWVIHCAGIVSAALGRGILLCNRTVTVHHAATVSSGVWCTCRRQLCR